MTWHTEHLLEPGKTFKAAQKEPSGAEESLSQKGEHQRFYSHHP